METENLFISIDFDKGIFPGNIPVTARIYPR